MDRYMRDGKCKRRMSGLVWYYEGKESTLSFVLYWM